MEFRILGPLDVRNGDQALELAGGRRRALLALLIVNANETVSTDRIVEELWGERSPQTAPKVIQNHVSQLRRGLGDGLLVTEGSGYRLRVEPGMRDVDRFEGLLSEGRTALESGAADIAARLFREALELWRGSPLADVSFEPFAQAEIARLEERRLVAFEERIEADLALGRHDDLVGELEALVAKNPLRERLRAQVMLALYRAGRQSEALAAYQDARSTLVEELGIEPGRPLRELHQAILNQDPALDLSTRISSAPQIARGAFVGREREVADLVAGLDRAFAGEGRLFLLEGEPGIGKSRLAEELIGHARSRGARILIGRCWEAGGAPAYWPWVQSLRAYVREGDSEQLRSEVGAGGAELAQIVPDFRRLFPDLPEPPMLDFEGARFRLFDAAVEFLRNASQNRPILLFLDDLHAADTPSLLLLQFLTRQLGTTKMLVLVAFRDVDPIPGQALTAVLAEVSREPVTRRLALDGLSGKAVAEYVEATASDFASPELVATLLDETEGNPLFLGETVRLLSVESVRAGFTPASVAVPPSVRDVIARRLTHLSDQCNRVLTLGSVLGREFTLDVLAHFAGMSEDEVVEVLDEAMVARVVAEVPGERGSLRFAHVLIRDTLYDGLTTVRRVQMHRQAVQALEALYGDDPGPHLAELAQHSIEGSEFDKALRYARRAGDRARALLAYEEAARLYRLALEALDLASATAEDVRCEVLIALGDAETDAGDGPAARRTFLSAAELARGLGSWEQLARAVLGYSGRDLWGPRAEGEPRIVPLLDEALTLCPNEDSVLRVKLLARFASATRGAVDREQPMSFAREAVEMAERIGDPKVTLLALGSKMASTRGSDNLDQSLADGLEVVRLAEELGEPELLFYGHEQILHSAWIFGDPAMLSTEGATMTRLAEQSRQPAKVWVVTAGRALSALWEGRFETAEELIDEAFQLGDRAESWIARSSYRLQTFSLRAHRGDLAGYEVDLRSSVDEYEGYRILECALISAYCELGMDDDARNAFERLAIRDFGDVAQDEDGLVNLCLLADACLHLGDASRAAILHGLLSPFVAFCAFAQPEMVLGSIAHYVARLAAALGRYDEAEQHFESALDLNARMGGLPSLAHTQHDYANVLLGRGEPGDAERAEKLLGSALVLSDDLGLTVLAGRIRAL